MRKIMSLVVVLTFAFSMAAYAQMGMGRGMGRAGAQQTSVANVEEAKALVLQQASNIKGAKLYLVQKDKAAEEQCILLMYLTITAKTYEYHVNPWAKLSF